MIRSGQTNEAKLVARLAQVKDLYLTAQQAGGNPAGVVQSGHNLRQAFRCELCSSRAVRRVNLRPFP